MKTIELRLAYEWDCDECGRENFERAVAFEGSEEEIQELRDEHGVEPWETGEFRTRPDKVKCQHCGAEFQTIEDNGEETW